MADTDDSRTYFEELKKRARESHVYSEHQLVGLMLAEILGDEEHKSLYIKLAKEYDSDMLLRLAKDIADRPRVENRGAYFMKLLYDGKNMDRK
ncbi:MAG: hypothetical protein PHV43_02485 [Candidatus Colwellbacteria bacterium]|nr:hypothetical protein [Candidatus Colwellbacteria bacterium]